MVGGHEADEDEVGEDVYICSRGVSDTEDVAMAGFSKREKKACGVMTVTVYHGTARYGIGA